MTVPGAGPTQPPTRTLSAATLQPSRTPDFSPLTRAAQELAIEARGVNNPTAAALPAHAQMPPIQVTAGAGGSGLSQVGVGQMVQITAPEGGLIPGMVHENLIPIPNATPRPDGTTTLLRTPGILIIGGALAEWGDFPRRLRDAGYTVLTVEMPPDATTETFSAVLTALTELGTVEPSLIAVIGAGRGADLALVGCAFDLACDMTVLISPTERDTLLNVLPNYGARPLFVAASIGDAAGMDALTGLRNNVRGEIGFQELSGDVSGVPLLANDADLQSTITLWINRFLTG